MSCEFVDEKQIGWTKWLRLKTSEPPKMDEFITYNYNTKNKDYTSRAGQAGGGSFKEKKL